jgi:hypothetical protein
MDLFAARWYRNQRMVRAAAGLSPVPAGSCALRNQTMTITVFRERAA